MDQSAEQRQSAGASAAAPMPRRALRKGTHSCGECKRRKTRCFFDSPRAAKCVGCQRRSTACISQEYVDVPAYDAREEANVAESLGQMQQMLEQIMRKTVADEQPAAVRPLAPADSSSPSSQPRRREGSDGPARPDESSKPSSSFSGTQQKQQQQDRLQDQLPLPPPLPPPPPPSHPPTLPLTEGALQLADTCRILHAAFPLQEDVDVLFEAGRAAIYLQALCNPYFELFAEGNARSLAAMSELPPATAHPVLLARKLLHLAICIQQLDPSFDPSQLRRLDRSLKDAMRHFFSLATSHVTCHDELLDSIEGLECLICEAVFLVNSGSLRRALLSLRRALTLAQFMGFHIAQPRQHRSQRYRQLDPATRVSGAVTWTHLVWLERFISLLLGLPTAITGGRSAPARQPDSETPSEWMEKVQVDLCARIMQRNQEAVGDGDSDGDDPDETRLDYATTQRIDRRLNAIAESLPPAWWSPLDLLPGMGINELMERMISAQIQIVHFSLIALLHLPYLLRRPAPETGSSCSNSSISSNSGSSAKNAASASQLSYSKSACTFACREVLTRFVEFRAFVRVVFCCRPVDFCALTAALVLLIAHLSGQRHADSGWLLPHHRRGDRALVAKAIETMDELNRLNDDELSRQTASLARRLLELEARCAGDRRLNYSASALPTATDVAATDDGDDDDGSENGDGDKDDIGSEGQDGDAAGQDSQSLLLQIPYFGAVRLSCEPTFPAAAAGGISSTTSATTATASTYNTTVATPATISSTLSQGRDTWSAAPTLAYTDLSSSSLNHSFVCLPGTLPDQIVHLPQAYAAQDFSTTMAPYSQSYLPMQVEQQQQQQQQQPAPFLYYDPMIPSLQVEGEPFNCDIDMPDLMAGTEAWAFQGVDGTVFDSLMRGANYPYY